jgi:hypothetical protein
LQDCAGMYGILNSIVLFNEWKAGK